MWNIGLIAVFTFALSITTDLANSEHFASAQINDGNNDSTIDIQPFTSNNNMSTGTSSNTTGIMKNTSGIIDDAFDALKDSFGSFFGK